MTFCDFIKFSKYVNFVLIKRIIIDFSLEKFETLKCIINMNTIRFKKPAGDFITEDAP